MLILALVLYGWTAFVALTNLLLIPRPSRRGESAQFVILIPARNEAENLRQLLPRLVRPDQPVFVFDDESTDRTGEIGRQLGATVLTPREKLPEGWTGKNRACFELAKAAAEGFSGEWMLFLDADVAPEADFLEAMGRTLADQGRRAPVLTGSTRLIAGGGGEPIFLEWVPWSLAGTNPFGLVARTGVGHNFFTNGQVVAWRTSTYWEVNPHETLRGRILEDVATGRLLARLKVRVRVLDLGSILGVRMYRSPGEAIDGMSKNSYEIAGSAAGTVAFALLMLLAAWLWLPLAVAGHWVPGALFFLSGTCVGWLSRRASLWFPVLALLSPITLSIGAYVCLRSVVWRRQGRVSWKGRTYAP